jgi:serine/threonine protein kinase
VDRIASGHARLGVLVSARRFGKYEVLGFLGRGGMAEVHLCRLDGIGGFTKQVVVKRILPERLGEPSFVRMFLDEARVAANLSHPNIVQVFEIDEADGVPYIAMEYVRGPTLAIIIREALRAKQLHLGHMTRIMAGVCAGLHHAHTATGAGGEALGLVHRDVSPQNIIVSPEGVPKLLDFGVAKAQGRLASTDNGGLKGKLRYMAPEQAQHGDVDRRADVFGAGVCLCEATTGQNPFGAPYVTEVQLLQNLVAGALTRPSALAARYPEVLDRIVLWAIDPDLGRRCGSAQDLQDALEAFGSGGRYASSARALATWLQQIVPAHLHGQPIGEEEARDGLAPGAGNARKNSRPKSSASWRAVVHSVNQPGTAEARPGVGMRVLRRLGAVALVAALVSAGAVLGPRLRRTASGQEKPSLPLDEAARAYVDEAERLARDRQLGSALDMVRKARELKIADPALNIRLARVGEEIETTIALGRARALLAAGQPRQAIEAALIILDRSPDNAAAQQLVTAARRAAAPARR